MFQIPEFKFEDDIPTQFQNLKIANAVPAMKYILTHNKYQIEMPEEVENKFGKIEDYPQTMNLIEKYRSLKNTNDQEIPECIKNLSERDIEVVFLGTSCAEASNYRSETCIYLNLFDKGGIVLDCGSGFGQFYRKFGKNTKEIIKSLKCVIASHMHGDHHSSVTNILSKRFKMFKEDNETCEPLLVIGPKTLKLILEEYSNLMPICYHFTPISDISDPNHQHYSFFQNLNIVKLYSIPVIHCEDAWGIAIQHTSGCKIIYSGDTMPCENIIRESQDCTLLIHESTFGDDSHDHAEAKKTLLLIRSNNNWKKRKSL